MKQPGRRLGFGEYEAPSRSQSIDDARERFFAAAAKIAPKAVNDLRAIYEREYPRLPPEQQPTMWENPAAVPPEIQRWGARWRVAEPWCLVWAGRRFIEWEFKKRGHPGIDPHPNVAIEGRRAGAFESLVPPLSLTVRGWNVRTETRAEFLERARATFEHEAAVYIEKQEAGARRLQLRPTPAIRQRGALLDEHFAWLAGYQCGGWSQNRIAEAVGINRAAVVRGINKLGTYIGLTTRRSSARQASPSIEAIRSALKHL